MTRFGLQLWAQQTDWPGFRDCGPRRRGGGLGLGLDVGPPDGHLRAVGAADLRGLERAGGPRADHVADPARADGRGQHVPQPGPHGQAGDDARPPLGRAGRPRHRRGVVRARARRLRHRLLLGPRRAARPAGRVGDAHAPAARWRAVQPRGPLLHVPRRAPRAAAGPEPPADPGRRVRAREDAPDRGAAGRRLEHAAGRSRRSVAKLDLLAEHCADVGRDIAPGSRRRSASRSRSATTGRRPRRPTGRCWRRTASRTMEGSTALLGSPPRWPTLSDPYVELGFATVIVRMPAPYDRETIDRMARVCGAPGMSRCDR